MESISARDLDRRLADLVRSERHLVVQFVVELAGFAKRELYRELGSTSLFYYWVRQLGLELPLGKAGQLDDELDYQMPLAPNQVGEAAVEITRGDRFHGNRLTRVSPPSCEGRRRPRTRDPAMAAFRHPVAHPRTAGRDAPALTP